MKNFILSVALLFFITSLQAQSPAGGKQYLYYERYQSAEDAFRQELQQNPGNAAAVYGVVQAHLMQDELQEAHEALNQASSAANNPWYQVARGYALLWAGNK